MEALCQTGSATTYAKHKCLHPSGQKSHHATSGQKRHENKKRSNNKTSRTKPPLPTQMRTDKEKPEVSTCGCGSLTTSNQRAAKTTLRQRLQRPSRNTGDKQKGNKKPRSMAPPRPSDTRPLGTRRRPTTKQPRSRAPQDRMTDKALGTRRRPAAGMGKSLSPSKLR